MEKLKYPIGQFEMNSNATEADMLNWRSQLADFPREMLALLAPLDVEAMHWQYRPDGWSISQLIHHCADSHMHALTRFKLALTEDVPNIKPYLEEAWAVLADGSTQDVEASLNIIHGLHHRWTVLMDGMTQADWRRSFHHPAHERNFNLVECLARSASSCTYSAGN